MRFEHWSGYKDILSDGLAEGELMTALEVKYPEGRRHYATLSPPNICILNLESPKPLQLSPAPCPLDPAVVP